MKNKSTEYLVLLEIMYDKTLYLTNTRTCKTVWELLDFDCEV